MIVTAQPLVEMVFDFDNGDFVADIIKLEENGFIILGVTNIMGTGKNIFIKLNNNGDTLWTKITPYYGSSIVEYDSSFYYIAGSASGVGTLTKINKNLNKIWTKSYPYGYGPSRLSMIRKTQNQQLITNYYYKWDVPTEPPRECLRSHDTSGTVLWSGDCYMVVDDIEQSQNSNFMRVAKSYYDDYKDYIIVEDSSGNFIYLKNLLGGWNSRLEEIVFYSDTAFVIGYDRINDEDSRFMKVFKVGIDSGNIFWQNIYIDPVGDISSACNGINNQILVTGRLLKDGIMVAYIFSFDSSGDSISTSYIDKFSDLRPVKIISYENSYYLVGTIYNDDESKDIYYLKAPLDTVLVNIPETSEVRKDMFKVMPNPASNKLNITLNTLAAGTEIRLYNSAGIVIRVIDLLPFQIEYIVDISSLPTGMYVAIMLDEGSVQDKVKVVISR